MASRARDAARRSTRVVIATAVVAAATVLAGPAEAGRAGDTCGMTVTSDYTLRHDLRCSGTAITVALTEPGQTVTLDLGRHALAGDGTGSGVAVNADVDGTVVVRNGQIRGFDSAVGGSGILFLTLRDLTVRDSTVWLASWPADVRGLTVERSRIVDSGTAGASTESTTTVRRSSFVRSGIASPSETYTYVDGSTFVGGGVSTGWAANVVAERNRFVRCDVGIAVQDSWPGSPTTVRHNHFVGCRVGMELTAAAAGSGANAVTIAGNQFLSNAEDGLRFLVYDPFGRVDVVGNRAVGNGGTGIAGDGAGVVTVTGNAAAGNGGHGIDVSGVVDGGGNVARANATPPQCIGVACSARR